MDENAVNELIQLVERAPEGFDPSTIFSQEFVQEISRKGQLEYLIASLADQSRDPGWNGLGAQPGADAVRELFKSGAAQFLSQEVLEQVLLNLATANNWYKYAAISQAFKNGAVEKISGDTLLAILDASTKGFANGYDVIRYAFENGAVDFLPSQEAAFPVLSKIVDTGNFSAYEAVLAAFEKYDVTDIPNALLAKTLRNFAHTFGVSGTEALQSRIKKYMGAHHIDILRKEDLPDAIVDVFNSGRKHYGSQTFEQIFPNTFDGTLGHTVGDDASGVKGYLLNPDDQYDSELLVAVSFNGTLYSPLHFEAEIRDSLDTLGESFVQQPRTSAFSRNIPIDSARLALSALVLCAPAQEAVPGR